jgi:hypothetical protein
MSTLELELLRANEQPKNGAFDYVTRLILPVLSLAALIATRNIKPALSWPLGIFAIVSFVVGLHQPIMSTLRKWAENRKDRRAAREAFPELRKFVHQFESFLTTSRSDTIHYIAQSEVCEGHGLRYNALALPELSVWHGFWKYLTDRLDRMDARRQRSITELRYELLAFFDLVGTYNHQCVWRLFDGLPPSEVQTLTPKAKSSLNAFQQRFAHFLRDYTNFATHLSESRPTLNGIHCRFAVPKPHS